MAADTESLQFEEICERLDLKGKTIEQNFTTLLNAGYSHKQIAVISGWVQAKYPHEDSPDVGTPAAEAGIKVITDDEELKAKQEEESKREEKPKSDPREEPSLRERAQSALHPKDKPDPEKPSGPGEHSSLIKPTHSGR